MATLTVSLNAGSTTSKVLTFSAADATRIMNAFQGTQQQLTDVLAQSLKDQIRATVVRRESVTPVPPDMV
jgi:hypothetical protein